MMLHPLQDILTPAQAAVFWTFGPLGALALFGALTMGCMEVRREWTRRVTRRTWRA
jgi:hypothetical protein